MMNRFSLFYYFLLFCTPIVIALDTAIWKRDIWLEISDKNQFYSGFRWYRRLEIAEHERKRTTDSLTNISEVRKTIIAQCSIYNPILIVNEPFLSN